MSKFDLPLILFVIGALISPCKLKSASVATLITFSSNGNIILVIIIKIINNNNSSNIITGIDA
jgi:hypothetical protein